MLLATFRLEPEAVALADTLRELPHLEIEAERIAAHSTTWTMPCLWATIPDFDTLDDALVTDSSVKTVVERTPFDDEIFYQVDWSDEVDDRINRYIDQEGSILKAEATADGWQIAIRFTTREQFDCFRNELHERGHSFELLTLIQEDEPRHKTGNLTPGQREALRAANHHGYFEVPRDISIRELADELEMSHQNLSKLLRRATGKLVEDTLNTSADVE